MKTIIIFLAVSLSTLAGHAAEGNGKVVADFNAPAPNNVEGNFGAFSPSETEQVYICREALDEGVKHGDGGSAMRLEYNVSKGGSYNGFWMKLGSADSGNNFDATGFNKLTFWIKGDDKAGIPNKFKIELKGDPGQPLGKKYVGEVTDSWKKVEIPLVEFVSEGRVDLSKLNEIVFVFEQRSVAPATTGAIYVDDVAFEK
jgi:hypothetical protein